MSVKEKIAYIKDIEEATAVPPGASPGNVVVYGENGLVDSQRNIDNIPTDDQVRQQIESAIDEHAQSDGHVTEQEKETWNSKQDAISDLSQIRSNAQKGAEAKTELGRHVDDTDVHVTTEEKAQWNAKQSSISDLDDIRENANKGASAYDRDSVEISNGEVDAVSSSVASSTVTVDSTSDDDESRIQARGFRMNLVEYLKHVLSGRLIRQVKFSSIKLYLSCSAAHQVKLNIFRVDTGDKVAVSDSVALSAGVDKVLAAFNFTEDVWLEADAEYNFEIVDSEADGYISGLTLYLTSSLIVNGFKEYSGGSYSPYEGCFDGISIVLLNTSERIGLAKKNEVNALITSLEEGAYQQQADWNQDDTEKPDYIKNKPKIPAGVTVDDTLSIPGAAADAAAVGAALSGLDKRYSFVTLVPEVDDNINLYRLVDKAVNTIVLDVVYGDRIVLELPSLSEGSNVARDFAVVFNVTTESEGLDEVVVECDGNAVDYAGNTAEIVALVGKLTSFRFLETNRSSDRFLVTGASDPSYIAAKQLMKALDDILADGGYIPFSPGVFIPGDDGLYYKLTAVKDAETEEVNIGIEQEGILK